MRLAAHWRISPTFSAITTDNGRVCLVSANKSSCETVRPCAWAASIRRAAQRKPRRGSKWGTSRRALPERRESSHSPSPVRPASGVRTCARAHSLKQDIASRVHPRNRWSRAQSAGIIGEWGVKGYVPAGNCRRYAKRPSASVLPIHQTSSRNNREGRTCRRDTAENSRRHTRPCTPP